jgi:hypothetical protein
VWVSTTQPNYWSDILHSLDSGEEMGVQWDITSAIHRHKESLSLPYEGSTVQHSYCILGTHGTSWLKKICHLHVVLVTKMTGSSSDDWILLALRLQPLSIALNHNAIAILHILQSLHTNPHSLLTIVFTTTLSLWINRPNLHHSLTAPGRTTLH